MVSIKNKEQIEKMREACRVANLAQKAVEAAIRPGISTWELDKIAERTMRENGAIPAEKGFPSGVKGVPAFPGSICASVNDVVIHGIPSKREILHDGDIISVDLVAYKNGFNGDCCRTYFVGNVSEEAKRLTEVTKQSFYEGIKRLKANGCHVKIIFGYKNGNKNVNGPDEIANELMKRDSLGYAKPEEVKEIVSELYNLLGKENFVYYPPLHAKIIIVDDEYMFMGSHNWLSNAGKTEEKKRAIEGTIITTSSDSISYTKEELFS